MERLNRHYSLILRLLEAISRDTLPKRNRATQTCLGL